MTLLVPERYVGSQEPTHKLVAPSIFSRGQRAIELAEMVGLELDPWQQQLLIDGLGVVDGEDAAGNPMEKWASYEVGVELSRQNGKSVVFEARVLAGLFLFRERLIVYSAHEGETAMSAYARLEELIRSSPELVKEIPSNGRSSGFRRGNGKEAITLWTGQQLRFRTRTAGGGRGLSGDCVILDEAQDLQDNHTAALMPTVSARPNAQLWYGGSAGTIKSTVQGRLIRRMEKKSPRLTFYRWAITDDDNPDEPRTWAKLNPAVGRRMTIETIASEHDAMAPADFGHERLGQGDYPREEGAEWVIPQSRWKRAADPDSAPRNPVMFSVEVKWDRERSGISVAGHRADSRVHFGLLTEDGGTQWAIHELVRLTTKHANLGVVIDPASPANTLVVPLRERGVTVHLLDVKDVTTAYGNFLDNVKGPPESDDAHWEPQYVHTGATGLTSMLAEAQTRQLGGATTWKRATSANVTGLLAATWAVHGLLEHSVPDDPPPAPQSGRDADATAIQGDPILTQGF